MEVKFGIIAQTIPLSNPVRHDQCFTGWLMRIECTSEFMCWFQMQMWWRGNDVLSCSARSVKRRGSRVDRVRTVVQSCFFNFS